MPGRAVSDRSDWAGDRSPAVREIDDDEGRRLVRIVRRGTGSVVTWRRAQMVLLSAQGMDVTAIAKVAFTSEDRVRDVIRNFNADGFSSLYPKCKGGGRPPKFTLGQRREIKKIAKSHPAGHGLPFSTWSLAKLAEFLVAEGVVDDISHEGLRIVLREEGVSFVGHDSGERIAERPETCASPRQPPHGVPRNMSVNSPRQSVMCSLDNSRKAGPGFANWHRRARPGARLASY